MSASTVRTGTTRYQECIVRDVLLEDNTIRTLTLAPGTLVLDVLREQGYYGDFIEVPRGLTTIRS